MQTLVSQPVPGGHLVLFDAPDSVRVLASYADEDGDPRDITEWAADLILLGLGVRQGRAEGQSVALAEEVTVAQVTIDGGHDEVRICYVHHPSTTAVSLELSDALQACAIGVASQITAGVAHAIAAEELDADLSDHSGDFEDLPTVSQEDDDPTALPPGA